jgi:hypothetical protein
MSTIKSGDRRADCLHCKLWSSLNQFVVNFKKCIDRQGSSACFQHAEKHLGQAVWK